MDETDADSSAWRDGCESSTRERLTMLSIVVIIATMCSAVSAQRGRLSKRWARRPRRCAPLGKPRSTPLDRLHGRRG